MTYEEQRRERLADVIFDYLSDEDVTSTHIYNSIQEEIQISYDYYAKHARRCQDLLDLMDGKDIDNYSSNNVGVATDHDWVSFWESMDNC